MARVPYPTRDEYPSAYLAAYDRMLRERGDPPLHIFLALANIPNLLDPLLTFTREMREGAAIEARLRELAIMTVALVTEGLHSLEKERRDGARSRARSRFLHTTFGGLPACSRSPRQKCGQFHSRRLRSKAGSRSPFPWSPLRNRARRKP